MTSIFKKSLACCLAIALCLTCMLSALTVSAGEVKTGTFTVENATVTPGTETAEVEITIDADAANVIIMQVETTAGEVTAASSADENMQVVMDANSKKIYVSNGDSNIAPFDSVVVLVTVALADTATETEYDVTAKLVSASSNVEDEFEIADATGKIIVKAEEPVEPPHVHTEGEIVCATPAEGTSAYVQTKAGSITFKCATCGEEFDVDVKWEYDYYFGMLQAEYASQINLLFSIENDNWVLNMKGTPERAFMYTSHFVTASESYVYKYIDVNDPSVRDTVQGASNWPAKTFTYPVTSLQLTEKVTAIPFVKVDGVWYSGDLATKSVRDYADEILAKTNITEKEKKLVVNMLTYGSKMQQFKDYNLDNLADANLGEYASLVDTSKPSVEEGLVLNPLDKEVYMSYFQLDMADKISVLYQFDSQYYSGANKSDLVVKADWIDANGLEMEATYTSADYAWLKDNTYKFTFDKLNSYDLRQVVTFVIYDGDTDVSGVFSASVEQLYAYGLAAGNYNSEEVAVYDAMLNYCDASYAHFINK